MTEKYDGLDEETSQEIGREVDEIFENMPDSPQFCVFGERDAVLPGLVLGDGTDCALPLEEGTVKKMIAYASVAPYGLGTETLVDTEVRRSWQIDAEQFSFRNPRWARFLEDIVAEVCGGLGVAHEVRAEPYKLLIYEAGGFFKGHRDTEKQKGMFATLVINLPCPHEGGQLRVQHDGETETTEFGGKDSAFLIRFAAFYADCVHEVLPVESGYRVNLVYNLCLSSRQKTPKAPSYDEPVRALAAVLKPLLQEGVVEKIVLPLKHQYTEAGLSPQELKGQDLVRFVCLSRLAQAHGMQAFLALLTFHQVGFPSYDSFEAPRRRWRGYDESDGFGSDTEFEEVHDEDGELEHWWTPTGESLPLGSLPFSREEFVSSQPLEEFEYEQSIEGPTGNEGVSMERWYRIAAVVLWETKKHFHILADNGQQTSIIGLRHWMASVKDPSKDVSCREFAEDILARWRFYPSYYKPSVDETGEMLSLLRELNHLPLVRRFLVEILPRQQSGEEGRRLREICEHWGWESFAKEIKDHVLGSATGQGAVRFGRITRILEDLCTGAAIGSEQQRVGRGFAATFFETLRAWDNETEKQMPKIDEADKPYHRGFWREHPERSELREKKIEAEVALRRSVFLPFCRVLVALEMRDLLNEWVAHAFQYEDWYDLRDILLPAARSMVLLQESSTCCKEPIQGLLQRVIERLEQRTLRPIPEPEDWSQSVKLGCKCEDCRDLQVFLKHPTEQTHRFAIAEKRREHLAQTIKAHRLDIEHTTERKGSPYKLVCTKTRTSYEQACRVFEEDVADLAACRLLLGDAQQGKAAETPQPQRKTRKK